MSLDVAYRDVPIPFRLAQVFGIATAAYMSGAISGMSLYTVPALLTAPSSVAVRQWKHIYQLGAKTMPPLGLFSSFSFATLYWRDRHTTGPRASLFLAAALIVPSIIPWTLVVMTPTNNKLMAKANETPLATSSEDELDAETSEAAKAAADQSVKQLLDKWATLNLVRGVITGLASVLGLWAVVGETKEMVFDLIA